MPRDIADTVREKLLQLAGDPFSPQLDAIKLQGRPGYRLRIGAWRVIYEIRNEELIILVLKIAPRGEVYR